VAQFEIIRTLRLLDLAALGHVRVTEDLADFGLAERLDSAMFMRSLSKHITRPAMPDDEPLGYVATQAIVDVSYGPKGIALLKQGLTPDAIIKAIWESDPDPVPGRWTKQGRQFAVINLKGETATFTGPKADSWAGGKQGKYCTAQGNILAGPAVVENMVKAFEETKGHLSLRFMAALEAGQAAGGDTRGMQAASMVIVKKGAGVWLNNDTVLRFQVDDQENPYKELRRVVENWNKRRPNPVRPPQQ